MSRAFAKEAEDVEDLPDRPISDLPNDVTPGGLHQIEQALAAAEAAHAAAQSAGDRAALTSARRDLRYWSARRATATVIPEPTDNSVVRLGHTVTIVREDDRRQTFRIVGEDEADPARGTISHASPLARALFGKGVGDVGVVAGGEAEIVEIR
ncbi:transcription elongation factor GreA [Bradyrhizobium valentinum]|uniref:Transcription elongation factor n=1 Tax=Bradyrhizobium valentinum TaxID=1518501 RepID=A0A0R3L0J0_9BRAD|nr:transcription elongation factor GreA [Bradyrhizobium valentinum]KRQ98671.1 transcription elongation factor [Bradyrhizobium valentinum]KRR12327.1 transcription elongation factor [Bradyrhizobium valentinum]